eukprot:6964425-Pyramimonas_sp.AAC.2
MSGSGAAPGVVKNQFERSREKPLARLSARKAAVQAALSPGSRRKTEALTQTDESACVSAGQFAPAPPFP